MFSKCISSSVIDVKETLEFAENKIFEKVDKITKEIMQNLKNPRSVAEKIVEAAFFADNIYIFQKNLKKKIKKVLNNYKGEAGQAGISALCMQLEIFPNGPRIISEYSVLAGEDWRKRREKMEKQDDFNYVIIELKGDDLDNNALERRYEVFKKKYEQLITYIFSGKADEKLD